MNPPQAKLGDISSHGGMIITGAIKTIINGVPVARMGDLHICPIRGHGVTPIITGSLTSMIEDAPAAGLGDVTACGAVIICN